MQNIEIRTNKTSLYALSYDKLSALMLEKGHKAFRAKQIAHELYTAAVGSIDDFRLLPKQLREDLNATHTVFDMCIVRVQKSADEKTKKYLIKTADLEFIEAVLMKYPHGYSLCISSQIGCRMGCTFCASTLNGISRNLTSSEMIQQVAIIQNAEDVRVSNVVLMGIGEPLDNYDNVVAFIRRMSSEDEFNLSARKITLSTCGLVDKIESLAAEDLPINLALSLHSPFDEERAKIMPVARRYDIRQTISAIDYYISRTGRRVSVEYALIKGENDSVEHARSLAQILRGKLIHVNIIPVNPVDGKSQRPTDDKQVGAFIGNLKKYGINATLRKRMGTDIDAACGQLRNRNQV